MRCLELKLRPLYISMSYPFANWKSLFFCYLRFMLVKKKWTKVLFKDMPL